MGAVAGETVAAAASSLAARLAGVTVEVRGRGRDSSPARRWGRAWCGAPTG